MNKDDWATETFSEWNARKEAEEMRERYYPNSIEAFIKERQEELERKEKDRMFWATVLRAVLPLVIVLVLLLGAFFVQIVLGP